MFGVETGNITEISDILTLPYFPLTSTTWIILCIYNALVGSFAKLLSYVYSAPLQSYFHTFTEVIDGNRSLLDCNFNRFTLLGGCDRSTRERPGPLPLARAQRSQA